MRKRNKNLHIRLTEQEMKDLRKKVERAGVNVQTFMIAAVYGTVLQEQPNEAIMGTVRTIRQASECIAEIAVSENEKGDSNSEKLWKVVHDLQEVTGELVGKGVL